VAKLVPVEFGSSWRQPAVIVENPLMKESCHCFRSLPASNFYLSPTQLANVLVSRILRLFSKGNQRDSKRN